ncbi:MAG: EF-hand domain-containing protein [Pseudomonadota bacterium]
MVNRIKYITLAVVLAGVAWSALAESTDGGQQGMMKRMWEMADTDKDGRISKAEFMAMSEQRFTTLDANGDGYIDENEREQAQARMRQHMAPMTNDGPGSSPKDH